MNTYYNSDYVGSKYAFDTTRKSGELASVMGDTVDPAAFVNQTRKLIRRVHSEDYVRAVVTGSPKDLAESQGFDWDAEVPAMVTAHSTGLVAAVTDVLTYGNRVSGSLSSGLHHARRTWGAGFCTFNGLAVATEAAFDLGAERVLILDFDAHCGGGTHSLIDHDRVVQIDVSTVPYDMYLPTGYDQLHGARAYGYLDAIDAALRDAERAGQFDLLVYNAGMDPFDSGVSTQTLGVRESMVAQWADDHDLKTVFALAGGYTGGNLSMDALVFQHYLTVEAFGG